MENFLKPQEPSSANAAFRQDLPCPGAFSFKGRNVRLFILPHPETVRRSYPASVFRRHTDKTENNAIFAD